MRPTTLRSPAALFADRPHGTRYRYLAGCRCVPCRAANSRYECERLAARTRGEGNGLIDAAPARAHLVALSRLGIGRNTVADITGASRTTLHKIRHGQRLCRAALARRILAIDRGARPESALVSSTRTRQTIDTLLAEGFTKARLATELGCSTPALQRARGPLVTVKTAGEIERLARRYLEA